MSLQPARARFPLGQGRMAAKVLPSVPFPGLAGTRIKRPALLPASARVMAKLIAPGDSFRQDVAIRLMSFGISSNAAKDLTSYDFHTYACRNPNRAMGFSVGNRFLLVWRSKTGARYQAWVPPEKIPEAWRFLGIRPTPGMTGTIER